MSAASELRWYQYTLRTLMLATLLACIGMSWVGVKIREARRQKQAVEAIKKSGGAVLYDYEDDFFGNVVEVQLGGCRGADAALEHVEGLTHLRRLDLDFSDVTDAGLENLKGLTHLQNVWLNDTEVTDIGLENLKGLTQLQILSLRRTKTTDAGWEHLKGLTQLEWLWLEDTRGTLGGVRRLQGALPRCTVCGP